MPQMLDQVTVSKLQLLVSISLVSTIIDSSDTSSIIDSSDTPTKLTAASRIQTRSDTSIGLLTSHDHDNDLLTPASQAELALFVKVSKSEENLCYWYANNRSRHFT